MKDFIKRNKFIIISFVITILLSNFLLIIKKVTPYGPNTLLYIDLDRQISSYFYELQYRLLNNKSLIYSFSTGLGIPFFKIFYYYLSSPLNILIIFFKRKYIPIFFSLLFSLKQALMATTMTYYLEKHHDKKDIKYLVLGIVYSFNTYVLTYYSCIMWLDSLYILPLLILGIEKIVKKEKSTLYIISLILALISNYYIGYMLCVFSLIYYLIYSIITNRLKTSILKYLKANIIVGLLVCFIFVPLFISMLNTSAISSDMFITQSEYLYRKPLYEILFAHIPSYTNPIYNVYNYAPYFACGILTIYFVLEFIINKNIDPKIKKIYLLLMLIFIMIFYLGQLDFIMNMFHQTNSFPYRYAFIYSFILLVATSYVIDNIKRSNKIVIIGLLLFIIITYYATGNIFIIVNMFLLIIYLVIINIKVKKVIIIPIILIDIIINAIFIMPVNTNSNLLENYDQELKHVSDISRTEILDVKNENPGSLYNYNGVSAYSSVLSKELVDYQNKIGKYKNEVNKFIYQDNSIIYDILHGIEYKISSKNVNYYKKIDDNLYKNEYYLGLIFGLNKDILNIQFKDDYIYNQNQLIYKGTKIKNIINEEKIDEDKLNELFDKLNRYNIKDLIFDGDKIEGNIVLEGNMVIYTSIPYEIGWNAYIDNEKVDTINYNGLLMLKGKKGNQKLTLIYRPPYQFIFSFISFTTLIVICGLHIWKKKNN